MERKFCISKIHPAETFPLILAIAIIVQGLVFAAVLRWQLNGKDAFAFMIGVALFGALFVWLMIFVTHLMFRRRTARSGQPVQRFGPRGPWTSIFGALALGSVLVCTWWVPGLRITVTAGLPWLLFITLCYFGWRKTHPVDPGAGVTVHG